MSLRHPTQCLCHAWICAHRHKEFVRARVTACPMRGDAPSALGPAFQLFFPMTNSAGRSNTRSTCMRAASELSPPTEIPPILTPFTTGGSGCSALGAAAAAATAAMGIRARKRVTSVILRRNRGYRFLSGHLSTAMPAKGAPSALGLPRGLWLLWKTAPEQEATRRV